MFRRAFTLVELLVVIAIISLLAAILFPVFATARANARRTVCVSQLRQLAMAARMYKQDWDEFPLRLSDLNQSYVREPRVFVCPSDQDHGHHPYNPRLEGDAFLPSGVSYDYVPGWQLATDMGWWNPLPNPGEGKWNDLTPLLDCNWHWAGRYNPSLTTNEAGARGWVLIATAGASVRKIRVEDPLAAFTPDKYR